MVEPSRRTRSLRTWILGCVGLLAGCSTVHRSKLDECHTLSRTLQSENSRLKDMVLSQKSEYEDLAQRADDDARRLAAKDEENKLLHKSVLTYQDELEKVGVELNNIKSKIRVAANPISANTLQRFETFAKSHAGCEFDPHAATLTVTTDQLFQPGTDRVKPEARPLMQSVANLLDQPEMREYRVLVAGHTADSPIQATGLRDEKPKTGHLSLERATRVREMIASDGRIDPDRIDVAGFEASQPKDDGLDDGARARNRRIEIQIRRDLGPTDAGSDP